MRRPRSYLGGAKISKARSVRCGVIRFNSLSFTMSASHNTKKPDSRLKQRTKISLQWQEKLADCWVYCRKFRAYEGDSVKSITLTIMGLLLLVATAAFAAPAKNSAKDAPAASSKT